MAELYDFQIKALDGQPLELMQFQGHVLLVVNVASRCGFTPQYTGLQQLYDSYQARARASWSCVWPRSSSSMTTLECVITSYSIHYTKLYEMGIAAIDVYLLGQRKTDPIVKPAELGNLLG